MIPAYNEAARITSTLAVVTEYLSRQAYEYEVLVVDDGSEDSTTEVVRRAYPDVMVISYPTNRGKGYAVKMGMLAAQGEYRVYYDADGSTPIEELNNLWPLFEAGTDIVIGSRALPESRIDVHQSWVRENMGRAYNATLRLFGLTRFSDTQCGFKGFTKDAAESLFPLLTMNRFSFDAELLFLAEKQGFRIQEIPVRWLNSPDSRVRLFVDSARMLCGAAAIRIKWTLGCYSRHEPLGQNQTTKHGSG